jgi:hypothetical protein
MLTRRHQEGHPDDRAKQPHAHKPPPCTEPCTSWSLVIDLSANAGRLHAHHFRPVHTPPFFDCDESQGTGRACPPIQPNHDLALDTWYTYVCHGVLSLPLLGSQSRHGAAPRCSAPSRAAATARTHHTHPATPAAATPTTRPPHSAQGWVSDRAPRHGKRFEGGRIPEAPSKRSRRCVRAAAYSALSSGVGSTLEKIQHDDI